MDLLLGCSCSGRQYRFRKLQMWRAHGGFWGLTSTLGFWDPGKTRTHECLNSNLQNCHQWKFGASVSTRFYGNLAPLGPHMPWLPFSRLLVDGFIPEYAAPVPSLFHIQVLQRSSKVLRVMITGPEVLIKWRGEVCMSLHPKREMDQAPKNNSYNQRSPTQTSTGVKWTGVWDKREWWGLWQTVPPNESTTTQLWPVAPYAANWKYKSSVATAPREARNIDFVWKLFIFKFQKLIF